MVFIVTFTVNSVVTDSVIIDREPRVQEVIAQQMELNAKGDKTLFELGCLDRSFYAASKQYPTVQYFYLPNVSMEESPEPFSGQMSYLQNKSTEYFIWRGFNPEHYPDAQVAIENYHHVTTYKTVDDDYYMLFQRK